MKTERKRVTFKVIMLVFLTAVLTFIMTTTIIYNTLGNSNFTYKTNDISEIGQKLEYYRKFIDQHYMYDVDENEMVESAIKGYFKGLGDEYSEYITKEEMQDYMTEATGKYVGIGVYITSDVSKEKIIVISPIKGSPAEEVGIKSGDIINKVDGIEYSGDELTEASNKLKGEEGTKVKVEILRGEEILEFEVERKSIKTSHVESKVIEQNIGYINIASFDDGTYDEFVENYNKLKESNIKSLIIDLRNNGGGIVQEATDIADMFTNKDATLLITKSKKEDEEEITKAKKDKEIDIPVVILVNEHSASASEILTLAIRENVEDSKVVGKTTYGKGVIQSIFTLVDGSGIKLTTNEYYSPKHNTINKVGIAPDYDVDLPEEENVYSVKEENDTQLQKAIEILK